MTVRDRETGGGGRGGGGLLITRTITLIKTCHTTVVAPKRVLITNTQFS